MENISQQTDNNETDPRDRDFYVQMGVCAAIAVVLVCMF